jgi:hypothetical protein
MMVIDTHLHYYDFYDSALFMRSLVGNLESVSPGSQKAGVVLDRAGMAGFEILADKAQGIPDAKASANDSCLSYDDADGSVKVYRGVQVACKEGFEVLGLFCTEELEDRLPAMDAIGRVTEAGGIAVVAWAPGKWMFNRRKLVSDLLECVAAGSVLLGDTALRPTVWGEPGLMHDFREKGGKVLCGSDPLPFPGQERVAGSYASLLSVEPDQPVDAAINQCLSESGQCPASVGSRVGTFGFACRMIKNRLSK